jgi:hypothetical protein
LIQELSKSREKDLIFSRLKSDLSDVMSEARKLVDIEDDNALDEGLGIEADPYKIQSQEDLETRLSESITGRLDGLRYTILSLVVEGRYDTAVAEINFYLNSDQKLEVFKNRAQRYLNHCEELIRAIESKIKFCQTRTITRSQKHELYMMVLKHFNELTESLKKIERIENDVRVNDLRSTVWVLKAFIMCVGIILMIGFVKEGYLTMKEPFTLILNESVEFIYKNLGM